MFIFGYDIVLDRLERVIHQLVELNFRMGRSQTRENRA